MVPDLHHSHFVHRDIKTSNCLLFFPQDLNQLPKFLLFNHQRISFFSPLLSYRSHLTRLKLCDFGSALPLEPIPNGVRDTLISSPTETQIDGTSARASDLWHIGTVLYDLCINSHHRPTTPHKYYPPPEFIHRFSFVSFSHFAYLTSSYSPSLPL